MTNPQTVWYLLPRYACVTQYTATLNDNVYDVKAKIHEMVNIEEIIERVKALKGFRSTKEVAELLKLSAQDFSNRKKRDTLLPLIVDWAVHENVSLDWLLTGEGVNMPAKGMLVAETPPAWGHPDPEIQAVVEIMESMDKDTKQDIRLSVEKEKLLRQLLRQREDREAG